VAYAIGRACGPAVTRNRLRRRLRHIMADLDRRTALPTGLLLIGAKPTSIELTFEELGREVEALIASMTP
jgi:ribonuclease P protein component